MASMGWAPVSWPSRARTDTRPCSSVEASPGSIAGTGEVVEESEGDDPPGDRLTDAVLQRDDEGIRHQLAGLSLLAVAGDDGEGSGISRAGKRQVSAAAGGEHQHEQERGGRGAHAPGYEPAIGEAMAQVTRCVGVGR